MSLSVLMGVAVSRLAGRLADPQTYHPEHPRATRVLGLGLTTATGWARSAACHSPPRAGDTSGEWALPLGPGTVWSGVLHRSRLQAVLVGVRGGLRNVSSAVEPVGEPPQRPTSSGSGV